MIKKKSHASRKKDLQVRQAREAIKRVVTNQRDLVPLKITALHCISIDERQTWVNC